MLHEFVAHNRDEIIRRCRVKVDARSIPSLTPGEAEYGVPRFLDQLVEALLYQPLASLEIDRTAALHGRALRSQGVTMSQVVHDYGNVCQSIADLALEAGEGISVEEFRTLNLSLDNAIASAVTEYGREDSRSMRDDTSARDVEHIGFLTHEIRNLVGTASLAFEVLKTGNVGVAGSTGGALERSLSGLRDIANRSVAEVRLRHSVQDHVHIPVAEFIEALASAAALDAAARDLRFTVRPGEADVAVRADRQILSAVITNLLQNAFKFTRPGTTVGLSVTACVDRVLIQIEDECGGLADGNVDELFRPFEQRNGDRSGLGLGLAFSRWGAEVNHGRVDCANRPNHGCVFTVELPRVLAPALRAV